MYVPFSTKTEPLSVTTAPSTRVGVISTAVGVGVKVAVYIVVASGVAVAVANGIGFEEQAAKTRGAVIKLT
jgi:hypothetical protein